MNMRTIIKATEVLVLAALCGCGSNPKSGYGLRLPDGDVEKGRQDFIALKCAECHKVIRRVTRWPSIRDSVTNAPSARVSLLLEAFATCDLTM